MSLNFLRRVDYATGPEGVVDAYAINLIAFNVVNAVDYPGFDNVGEELQLKEVLTYLLHYDQYVVGGTTNDITLTNVNGNSIYRDGMIVKFIAKYDNTGPVTIKINNGNVLPATTVDGSIFSGMVRKDSEVILRYDSATTSFQIINGFEKSIVVGDYKNNIEIIGSGFLFSDNGIPKLNLKLDVTSFDFDVYRYDINNVPYKVATLAQTGEILTYTDAIQPEALIRKSQLDTSNKKLSFIVTFTDTQASTVSFGPSVITKMPFDLVIEDSHNVYDVVNNTIIIPKTGYYHFSGNVRISIGSAPITTNARVESAIYVNGVSVIGTGFYRNNTGHQSDIPVSALVSLKKGDVVEMYVMQNSTNTYRVGSNALNQTGLVNYLCGFYIGDLNV